MNIILSNRALLKVSGSDCLDFLQGQLSNDIKKLDNNIAQINAYCQHQGKIIALLWVIKEADYFYLSMPIEMLEIVENRLRMFILMSAVTIEKSNLLQIGITSNIGKYKLNKNQSINLTDNHIDTNNLAIWEKCCIENNLAEIYLNTTEKFIPQMLNLDIDEIGVNFTKGCYPGQEIVARLHYLGKAKRRLFKFISKELINVGDELITQNSASQKSSGIVVRMVKSHPYLFLATMEIAHINSTITINNKTIKIINE